MYTEDIRIYSRFVVIYRIILNHQNQLIFIIRSFDFSCKSSEHKHGRPPQKTPGPGAPRHPSQALRPQHRISVYLLDQKIYPVSQQTPPERNGRLRDRAISYPIGAKKNVAASTQNQAQSALLFLDREVLNLPLDLTFQSVQARRPKYLPTVLSKTEVERVLRQMSGETLLMAQLLYDCNLRLMECLRLRVKDIDFDQHQIMVRDPKGIHDRTTMLPVTLELSLQVQLQAVKHLHGRDLASGHEEVSLPYALAQKYPNAARELHARKNGPGNSFFLRAI